MEKQEAKTELSISIVFSGGAAKLIWRLKILSILSQTHLGLLTLELELRAGVRT